MNRFEIPFRPLTWSMAMLLAAFVAGCGGDGGNGGSGGPGPGPGPVSAAGVVCDAATTAGCVDLKSAGTYAILAQSAITNGTTSPSAVTGDVGLNNVEAAMVGFTQTKDASNTFSTSAQVTGKLYANDYADPTPANLAQAVADAIAAYGDASTRTPADTDTNGGILGGTTIGPGVHRWSTNVVIGSDVTLSGGATDVFILQVPSGNVTQAASTNVVLTGGALPQNVFWQVRDGVSIGAGAQFRGVVLTGSAITLGDAALVNGRLITGGAAVTLDHDTVTRPGS